MRGEWPAWGHVYNRVGLGFSNNGRWDGAGWRKLQLRDSGCEVWLDLSSSFERGTFFLGRYQETDLQIILRTALGPGGQFIDGGANIGLLSLLAASIVGREGAVHAFEPNPLVHARLVEHAKMNGLDQLTAHLCGLSDQDDNLTFRILDGGSESGTFASIAGEHLDAVTSEQTICVRRGDDVLTGALTPGKRTMIKMDVEGFETQALRGLSGVIHDYAPVITTEYQPHLTARASVDALFDILLGENYGAFMIGLRRAGVMSHDLVLTPIADASALTGHRGKHDVLWLRDEGMALFEKFITRTA